MAFKPDAEGSWNQYEQNADDVAGGSKNAEAASGTSVELSSTEKDAAIAALESEGVASAGLKEAFESGDAGRVKAAVTESLAAIDQGAIDAGRADALLDISSKLNKG